VETTDHQADRIRARDPGWNRQTLHRWVLRLRTASQPLLAFWTKLNNDWVFNLSGLLAYNFLMSLFPILLVLLAALGFALGDQASGALAQVQQAIERAVPGGGQVFQAVSNQLANSAGFLLVIGVVTSVFAGSRLFIVLENCFGVIFRIRGRDFVHQNLMAFGMLLIYLLLATVMILASAIPSAILPVLDLFVPSSTLHFLTLALSILVFGVSALILFGSIYLVVPNRRVRLGEVWPGTVLATLLLILYESLFPTFVSVFLRPSNYGAVAGFAIVSLLFFYYLAFILLCGAEVNAWIAGRRQTPGDIAAVMYDLRSRDTKPAEDR
jgi:YihY family inner membrane protein